MTPDLHGHRPVSPISGGSSPLTQRNRFPTSSGRASTAMAPLLWIYQFTSFHWLASDRERSGEGENKAEQQKENKRWKDSVILMLTMAQTGSVTMRLHWDLPHCCTLQQPPP
ncbi:hypothetical protein NQZ68_024798 [Dissostichus eleginoides]|nr:hypothetical protein NQZ68_024798 [Dissostichus eleginoides]